MSVDPIPGHLSPLDSQATTDILHISDSSTEPIAVDATEENTHLLIVIECGVEAHVTEMISPSCNRRTVEIVLEDNAALTFLSLHQSSDLALTQRSRIGAGAKIHWKNVTLGGDKIRHDLLSEIAGKASRSDIDWISYARDDQSLGLSARNVFLAEDGTGEITMRGVAEGNARLRCDGMIEISPEGRGTEAFLREDVLMLDPTAKVDAIPGLEIKTNDVKASHSATVSKVTEDDLFYFSARGIAERDARKMYITGFLGGAITANPMVSEAIEQLYQFHF